MEGYTGQGEPPCIVMTLSRDEVSDKATLPTLCLPVALIGLEQSLPSTITLEIKEELSVDRYGFNSTVDQLEAPG